MGEQLKRVLCAIRTILARFIHPCARTIEPMDDCSRKLAHIFHTLAFKYLKLEE